MVLIVLCVTNVIAIEITRLIIMDSYVVTCGADGEMRIWDAQTILEEGPLSITFGSHCNSVVVQVGICFGNTTGSRISMDLEHTQKP